MSTTEPTDEMVEAAARRWVHHDNPTIADIREARFALRAALAVAPAPSEDDRKALASAIIDAAWDEGPHPDSQTALVWADAILAAGFRRSPVSPPEDVKPGAGSLSVERPNESRPDSPPEDVTKLIETANRWLESPTASVEGGRGAVRALVAALRAPVPVETECKRILVDHDEHGVWTDDQGDEWIKRENVVAWRDADINQGKAILDELHERGVVPNTLITPSGVTFVVGQRVGWKLNGMLKQAGGIGTITEFDPRRGLTDGQTIKVEREGKDPVWVHPGWISVWEDPE